MPVLPPPPDRIVTPRLVLRRRGPADAPLVKAAVDASLPELRRWMAWAAFEPSPLAAFVERSEAAWRAWDEGREFGYAILPPDEREVLGACGVHPRNDDSALVPDHAEVGYWIRSDVAGRGYATEAARAVVAHASRLSGIDRVEIRCDPRNAPSVAIARRLGFRHARTMPETVEVPVGSGRTETMVWEWRGPYPLDAGLPDEGRA